YVDSTINKSLSKTAVQHGAQPTAPTDKKSRKKKIPFFSETKTSNVVRKSPSKKQFDDTHHAEEPVATKGIESYESAEELRNQTKPAEAKKVHEIFVEEAVKDYVITSLGIIPFKELYGHAKESPFDTEPVIKFIGKEKRLILTLESMHDDEIESVSGFEADDDEDDPSENKEELSQTVKADADNVIDELVDMANSKMTT
ncbi:hypothetical protein Tco_0074122, partial [Tanacetum coccineum]